MIRDSLKKIKEKVLAMVAEWVPNLAYCDCQECVTMRDNENPTRKVPDMENCECECCVANECDCEEGCDCCE